MKRRGRAAEELEQEEEEGKAGKDPALIFTDVFYLTISFLFIFSFFHIGESFRLCLGIKLFLNSVWLYVYPSIPLPPPLSGLQGTDGSVVFGPSLSRGLKPGAGRRANVLGDMLGSPFFSGRT